MSKQFVRLCFGTALILAVVCFGLSQKAVPGYPELRRQYIAAQHYYDQATALNNRDEYGAAEEALEKQWNEKALRGFAAVYGNLPANAYDSLRFYVCFKLGELHHYFENFSDAIRYYQEAIAVNQRSRLPDSLLFKPYLYAGLIFYNQNKYDTAVQVFKKAEAVQARHGNRLSEAERLYNILGVMLYERGNYKQAQNYIRKALTLLPVTHPFYDELSVNYKINLAQLHLRLEEYEKANQIYQELLPQKINLNEIYHNIGTLNLSLGAASKAITSFRKVRYQNNKIIRLYNSMGEAFFNLNQHDSALHYYQKAMAAYRELGQNADKIGYGLTLKNMGDYHLKKNEPRAALRFYQQAIRQFYPSFQAEDTESNPETFSGVFSYINLFNALNAKADAWQAIYTAGNKREDGDQVLRTYQSAFRLIAYVEMSYDSDEARLFLAKTKHAVHGKPIDIAFELYTKTKDVGYLETLYYFDQQNKAAVLTLNRQLNSNFSETGSPQLKKEQQLKEEITRLSIRAAQLTDSSQLTAIHTRIRDREIELGKLQEGHLQNASGRSSIPGLSALQKKILDDETLLVSYHLSDDKLTVTAISRSEVSCHQQPLPADFHAAIQERILQMKSPAAGAENKNLHPYADLFFSRLSLERFRQLIIIPDDVLAYFPFESLPFKNKYLVEHLAVQYQYSTALLEKNNADFATAKTLSFAPFAHQSFGDSLPLLPASGDEVKKTKGMAYLDEKATKESFLQNSNKFDILHLATHAVANSNAEGLSYVVFSPEGGGDAHLLYTREIYNLRLANTDLVILSACETGTGQLVKGEGVLSLSRAFSYAGCPNIITSLWKADDFSTAYLTSRIHGYLQQGAAVSEAVRKAKTDYLHDQTIHPRLKQPYYWAHLVFIGNYQPREQKDWTWLAAGAAGLGLLVFLYFRQRNDRRKKRIHHS